LIYYLYLYHRLEQLRFQQNEEREQKLRQWEIWIIRITELEKKCQEKLGDLKSKGEPQDKMEVEDQIILAKVSFQSYVYANLYVAFFVFLPHTTHGALTRCYITARCIFPMLQEFQEELQSAKPAITDGLDYGKHLIEDDTINEDNKAKIRQDVHHFEGDLVKLEQANDDEHKRYHLEACYWNIIPLIFLRWSARSYLNLSFSFSNIARSTNWQFCSQIERIYRGYHYMRSPNM